MAYSINILFTEPSPAPIGGYRVRYRIAGSNDAYTLASGAGSPITINNLVNGVSYEGLIDGICANGVFSVPIGFNVTPPSTTTAPITTTVFGSTSTTTLTTTATTTTQYINVEVLSNLPGVSLTSLTDISGYTLPESVEDGEFFTGLHVGYTGGITFIIDAAPGDDASVLLYIDGVFVECVNLSPAATYPLTASFTSRTYTGTNVIRVEVSPEPCIGLQIIYVGSHGTDPTIPTEAEILAATRVPADPLADIPVDWQPFNSVPGYLFMAAPDLAGPKVTWFVDILNQGAIGGPTNLFPDPTPVLVLGVLHNVYMTNYQTQFVAICEMRIA